MAGIDSAVDPRGARWEARLRKPAFILLGVTLVGIGDRIVSGEKHPTPVHGTWDVLLDMPDWTLALTAAGTAALLLVALSARLRTRRADT